eukprot:TRINITY_DN13951_c0_g1_i1.p2 TRINITY_DN13951_c0_g1~~TRINITY_DN13951_c0_g1_i1.p2  ORF type:complete len:531 (+),score=231.91 TRINITY_DN13951_c0_g1_i1:119-1711(+)
MRHSGLEQSRHTWGLVAAICLARAVGEELASTVEIDARGGVASSKRLVRRQTAGRVTHVLEKVQDPDLERRLGDMEAHLTHAKQHPPGLFQTSGSVAASPSGLSEDLGKRKESAEASEKMVADMKAQHEAALRAAKEAAAIAEEAKKKAEAAAKQLEHQRQQAEEQAQREKAEFEAAQHAARLKQAKDEKAAREEQEKARTAAEKARVAAKMQAEKAAAEAKAKAAREQEEAKRKAQEKVQAEAQKQAAEEARKAKEVLNRAMAAAAKAKEEMEQRKAAATQAASRAAMEAKEMKDKQDELERKAKEAEEKRSQIIEQNRRQQEAVNQAQAEPKPTSQKQPTEVTKHVPPAFDYAAAGLAKPEAAPAWLADNSSVSEVSPKLHKLTQKQAKAAFDKFDRILEDSVPLSHEKLIEAAHMKHGAPSWPVVQQRLKEKGLALTEEQVEPEPASDVIREEDSEEGEIVSDILRAVRKANPDTHYGKAEGRTPPGEPDGASKAGTQPSRSAGRRWQPCSFDGAFVAFLYLLLQFS